MGDAHECQDLLRLEGAWILIQCPGQLLLKPLQPTHISSSLQDMELHWRRRKAMREPRSRTAPSN